MNDERDFGRRVSEVFDGSAPSHGPDDLLEEVFLVTGDTRPRPRWWARLVERPMRYDAELVSGSPRARAAVLVAATMLLVLALAGAAIAGAQLLGRGQTWVVAADGSGDFSTITEAVAATADGDMVLIRPGTYVEAFTVRTDITLRGDGPRGDVVIAPMQSDIEVVLSTDASPQLAMPVGVDLELVDVVIEGLELQAAVPMVGIVANGGDVALSNVRITSVAGDDGLAGLSLLVGGGSTTTMTRADLGQPLQVREAASLVIDDSDLAGTLDATGPGRVDVVDSRFGPGGGIEASGHASGSVRESTFDAAMVMVAGASDIELRQNSFVAATGTAITVANEGSRATIVGNEVRDANAGIAIGPGTTAIVAENTVCGNRTNLLASNDASTDLRDNIITETCPGE